VPEISKQVNPSKGQVHLLSDNAKNVKEISSAEQIGLREPAVANNPNHMKAMTARPDETRSSLTDVAERGNAKNETRGRGRTAGMPNQ
jgi:hypothetical protein